MLVPKLYEIFGVRKVKKEKGFLNECPGGGDGIWDILGYYDPSAYEITVCESRIEKFVRNSILTQTIEFDEIYTKVVLRELVRLHEHTHALLHTSSFPRLKRYKMGNWKIGYRNLHPSVNEPLTEFLAWSVVQRFGTKFCERVFEIVDEKSPSYYREWKKIKDIIDKVRQNHSYVFFILGLVYTARDMDLCNFQNFLQELKNNLQTVYDLSTLFNLTRSLSA